MLHEGALHVSSEIGLLCGGAVVTLPSIAIESYVVPDVGAAVPDGFELLRVAGARSVPCELPLGDGWSVIVVVPAGTAKPWLDADPNDLVTSSDYDRLPIAAASGAFVAPARLVVRRGGGPPLAAVPLIENAYTRVQSDGATTSLLELIPIAWEITAATVVGSATAQLRLDLAWRTRFPVRFPVA